MKRLLLTVAGALLFMACHSGPPLPTFDPIPNTTLQSSDGANLELADLNGDVVIYDFIFTRCVASCPMMTARMAELASKLRSDDLRFVSISVDPEWDTPKVLEDYRESVTTDDRWMFLTGTRESIRELSVDGFKLAADPPEENVDSGPIVHSSKFILADREGTIRGYYDSLSRDAMEQLERDAKRLLKE